MERDGKVRLPGQKQAGKNRFGSGLLVIMKVDGMD